MSTTRQAPPTGPAGSGNGKAVKGPQAGGPAAKDIPGQRAGAPDTGPGSGGKASAPGGKGFGRTSPWLGRRGLYAAGVVALIAVGGTAALVSRGDDGLPKAADPGSLNPSAAITLPDDVLGLKPLEAKKDGTQTPAWKQKAALAGRGATVVGRMYGTGGATSRTVRLVVGRADLTGQLEQAWAAPNTGQVVGTATCTNNTVIVKNTPPRIRPTVMLCWRTSAALSAYSLIIDPKAKTAVSTADGAAALDAAWRAAGGKG